MMKVKKELAGRSQAELVDVVALTQKRLFQLKSEQVVGRLTKTSELWKARKTIAIAKTMISVKKKAESVKEVQHATG
jgi:ribosomal protein L29